MEKELPMYYKVGLMIVKSRKELLRGKLTELVSLSVKVMGRL